MLDINNKGTRGHSCTLIKGKCTRDIARYFANKVINRWNALEQSAVDASSINVLRTPYRRLGATGWVFNGLVHLALLVDDWLARPYKVNTMQCSLIGCSNRRISGSKQWAIPGKSGGSKEPKLICGWWWMRLTRRQTKQLPIRQHACYVTVCSADGEGWIHWAKPIGWPSLYSVERLGLLGWVVYRHFGPQTLRTPDTSAPVPNCPQDTSALVPKCLDTSTLLDEK